MGVEMGEEMGDIVERLRKERYMGSPSDSIEARAVMHEAADEIERLRDEIGHLGGQITTLLDERDTHDAEVEIKIAQHLDSWRVWIHINGVLAVRVYRAKLTLDGVKIVNQQNS
jgi:hypothetical protein